MSCFILKLNFVFLLLIFLFLSAISFAQRTDIIIMNNDDHITGEIKKMQYGIVTFKTDDAGTLSIKWDKIRHLISTDIFEVQVQD
ncbi:MAG: hypothetical protein ACW99A_20595, partial [Candidatus Kariarchaeaceae archaeon]